MGSYLSDLLAAHPEDAQHAMLYIAYIARRATEFTWGSTYVLDERLRRHLSGSPISLQAIPTSVLTAHEAVLQRLPSSARTHVLMCDHCLVPDDHASADCPTGARRSPADQQQQTVRYQPRSQQQPAASHADDSNEPCRFFNSNRGCMKRNCDYVHVCSHCNADSHGRYHCPRRPKQSGKTSSGGGKKNDSSTSSDRPQDGASNTGAAQGSG